MGVAYGGFQNPRAKPSLEFQNAHKPNTVAASRVIEFQSRFIPIPSFFFIIKYDNNIFNNNSIRNVRK